MMSSSYCRWNLQGHDESTSEGDFVALAAPPASRPGFPAAPGEAAQGGDTVMCLWEECGIVFTHLPTLIDHIHSEHIGVHKSNYTCRWATCSRRGLAQTSRFALIIHIRSHTGEKLFNCSHPAYDKSFTRSDALAKHVRLQRNMLPPTSGRGGNRERKRSLSPASSLQPQPTPRERQRHIQYRQSRVPADLPDSPPDLLLLLHESASALTSPECSSLTTCARNASKVQDSTHSVTSSVPDPPAVQQGIHQAISLFCNTLSDPQFSVSLVEAPNDWLRANSSQILQVPSICGKEHVEVNLIYPRFFVYTLEFLECYVPSEVESLKAKYIEWTNHVDEITQLINHESIKVTLDRYLAQHKTGFQLNNPAIVDKILKLDALSIVARILAMLREPQRRRLLLGQRGSQAQSLLDLIQMLLDSFDLSIVHSFLVKTLVELSKRSGLYPQRLLLPNIDIRGDQVDGGTFGDVWKGDLDGRPVAVKKMRVFRSSEVRELMKAYTKEAVLWAQLSSPFVVPFCGVYCTNEPSPRACLVSPWMDNGNLPQYLKDNPKADRLQLMQDVALGLEYLHSFSLPVIHGDLKGLNILIASGPRACIADFGLSIIAEDPNFQFTVTATSNGLGSIPWMAPELFDCDNPERKRKSRASDIYALGSVGYEMYAGRPPFFEHRSPMRAIMDNRPLLRPAGTELDDAIWELIEKCRRTDPASRPDASEVVRQLRCHPGARDYELAPLYVWYQKKGAT
ncbi:kinase-like protein [Leucogyrophana mollusca]|uniref:Kinase-like protein n=1 Tax=Leucogyrophana mollusca TaxID=85980 RepID=A0ACB8B014_9AGAM|nr:kinase-like protein [Leucogyrophana mollusca]